jgi:hypothetical protein
MTAMPNPERRLILPVPNLAMTRVWEVGRVRFHPAGTVAKLVEDARLRTPGPGPAWYQELVTSKGGELDRWAVAEVTAAGIDEAVPMVSSALAILRIVQHTEHPMVDVRLQSFGLPGQVMSASIDYLDLTQGPAYGGRRLGAAGGWTLNDEAHDAWTGDPAYRFIDAALAEADADRTPLQRRAFIAIDLLRQAWLSWQPDVALLNSAMALEVLLGEPDDNAKKFRLARRVCYFVCGRPNDRYPDGRRPSCPYLALPIDGKGRPGPGLGKIIRGGRQGAYDDGIYCSQFFDVLDLYDDRNNIVHHGQLGLTQSEEGQATWFIASWLLRPLLRWFSEHPKAALAELDAEIAALPARASEPSNRH